MLRNVCKAVSVVSRSSGMRTSVKTSTSGQCQLISARMLNGATNEKADHESKLHQHRPTNFEKRLLVWNQRYPSIAEIPEKVTQSEVKNAYDWFRIRTSIGMMIAGAIACLVMAKIAKKERDEGESLHKQNVRWHEEYNKKHA